MSKNMNMLDRVKKTINDENNQTAEIYEDMDSLVEVSRQLQEMREKAALEARYNDIEYVNKIDDFISTILDSISENQEGLAKTVVKMLEQGDTKRLKDLMVALGISIDKREALLGYDEDRRGGNKRKMRLRVAWKGTDGSEGGVSIEEG